MYATFVLGLPGISSSDVTRTAPGILVLSRMFRGEGGGGVVGETVSRLRLGVGCEDEGIDGDEEGGNEDAIVKGTFGGYI